MVFKEKLLQTVAPKCKKKKKKPTTGDQKKKAKPMNWVVGWSFLASPVQEF